MKSGLVRAAVTAGVLWMLVREVNASPWTSAELNEKFMRSLTRSQCVEKTLQTMQLRCHDDARCLQTIVGAMGDCVSWTPNDAGTMCAYLPSQSRPLCESNSLSTVQCQVVDKLTEGFCNGSIADTSADTVLSPKDLFKYVSPSIVVVIGLDPRDTPTSQGSGVVINSEVVASNCHVLYGAQRAIVRYLGVEYRTAVQYSDIDRDVCTLSVAGLPAPPVMADTSALEGLAVGDKVYAVGTPRGLEQTFSDGLVSGFRHEKVGTYIQTTAPISPGSSGGGLFSEKGRLLGLTTLYLADSQQLNFAIPVTWIDELPERSARSENLKSARQFAREALNQLEAVLIADDPLYRCKKGIALPAARSAQARMNPLMWADMFLQEYQQVDPAACRK